jgi:AcrR family transcriptional regulator
MLKESERRSETRQTFLDAAERLLVRVGYARITTRLLAAEAGANQGLVHYYFGALEEVLVQVLDRFTARLIERQRAMYQAEGPFLEKWRTAWRFQEQDLADGYPKIWFELQAMSWNQPELRERIEHVNRAWRAVLHDAFSRALAEYGVTDQYPVEVMVSLVMTFAQGYQLERLSNIREGHAALLRFIDQWLKQLDERSEHERQRSPAARARRKPRRSPRR